MNELKFEDSDDRYDLKQFSKRLKGTPFENWPISNDYFKNPRKLKSRGILFRRILLKKDGKIRAKVNFYEHKGLLRGKLHSFVWSSGILSEVVVNKSFRGYGRKILEHSLKLQPYQMVMGHISKKEGSGALFLKLGWSNYQIPIWLLPINAPKCIHELINARNNIPLKILKKLPGFTKIVGKLLTLIQPKEMNISIQKVEKFDKWANVIWEKVAPYYEWLVVRDADTINWQYNDSRVHKIRVFDTQNDIGWVLVAITNMKNNSMFGNLVTGTIVDGLCNPKDSKKILTAAVQYLKKNGAEIIYCFWSHRSWQNSCKQLGFLKFKTTQSIYISPQMSKNLNNMAIDTMHFGRGDCDGPASILQ